MDASGLPAGLSIAPTTGIVSGTPTTTVVGVPGSIAITVTDNFGCAGTRNTTVTIRPVAGNERSETPSATRNWRSERWAPCR